MESEEQRVDDTDSSDDDDEDEEGNDNVDDSKEVDRPESHVGRIRRSIERNIAASRWNPSTNPYHDSRVKLHSNTFHYLGVYADGVVRGTQDKTDLHTHLELVSIVGSPGQLRILGLLTHQYVAMNSKGRVYATTNMNDDNTVFIQKVKGLHYQTYLSRQFASEEWYLAIKKNGKMKNGKRTAAKQKAAQFISIPRNQYFAR